jgi:hypothetical protein
MPRAVMLTCLVLLLGACQLPTAIELQRETFDDVFEVQDRLGCREVQTTFLHVMVGSEDDALELARSAVGQDEVNQVVDAGAIWLLVDSDGEVFGAIGKALATVTSCVNH